MAGKYNVIWPHYISNNIWQCICFVLHFRKPIFPLVVESRLKDAKDCNGDIIYMPEDDDIIQTIVKTLNETRQLIWDKGFFLAAIAALYLGSSMTH